MREDCGGFVGGLEGDFEAGGVSWVEELDGGDLLSVVCQKGRK